MAAIGRALTLMTYLYAERGQHITLPQPLYRTLNRGQEKVKWINKEAIHFVQLTLSMESPKSNRRIHYLYLILWIIFTSALISLCTTTKNHFYFDSTIYIKWRFITNVLIFLNYYIEYCRDQFINFFNSGL